MFKLQFKDQPHRGIWLVGESFKLGASTDNDLVIEGLGIDEFHAEILIDTDLLLLKSKAGSCFVNDLPVNGEHRLFANDELRIGKQRLLIIDPKQQYKQSNKPTVTDIAATGWSLVPVHPKLQDRDFTITESTIVGRSSNCRFAIPYKLLSREHAQLSVVNGELMLKDLDSANGCFVNDQPVTEARLYPDDKVSFAKLAFTVKGPVVKPIKAPVSAPQELNKTMIRPAIKLEQELQRSANIPSAKPLSLSLEESDNNNAQSKLTVDHQTSAKRWPIFVAVMLLSIAVGWWFSPLNSF